MKIFSESSPITIKVFIPDDKMFQICTVGILPSMTERKKGHIVAVSSVQGKFAIPNRSAYTASKHACDAFFNCLRAEVAEDGINVTVASPGYIRTNISINARTGDGQQYGGCIHLQNPLSVV